MRVAYLMFALLAGCAELPANEVRTGDAVTPPSGFTQWCKREPWQPACGGTGR